MAEEGLSVSGRDELVLALEEKLGEYKAAGLYGLTQVAFAIESAAKKNFDGTHKRGERHVPNGTGGPNVVTGALRRSIHTEVREGFGTYTASVFPTMVYSRAVELGGKGGARYPYLMPAAAAIKPQANQIFTAAVKRRMKG